MTFTDLLLSVARILGSLFVKSVNLRRARKLDAAVLFENVADCLKKIADKFENGIEPVEECSEIFYYSQRVPIVIKKVAGFWGNERAKQIADGLQMATDAPSRAAFNLQTRSGIVLPVFLTHRDAKPLNTSVESEIRKLREASGLFRAASHLVRSGSQL